MIDKGYLLHTFGNGEIALCRVIKEYAEDDEKEAIHDLVNVTVGKISERKLGKNGLRINK